MHASSRSTTSVEQERKLFQRYRSTGDPVARDAIITNTLPLAHRVARRFAYGREPFEDLLQVASLALVKAVDRFDPERGLAFSSYAVPTMVGEIKRYFRDSSWALHLPRGLKEQALDVGEAERRLADRSGRSPTTAELAEATGLTLEQTLEARAAATASSTRPLDAPLARGAGEERATSYAEVLGDDDPAYERVEERITIAAAARQLSAHDRELLQMRFLEEMTQQQIAGRMGVSQMQISRLLRRTLDTLREEVAGGTVAVQGNGAGVS
jgi:RNA polymerase sigma-B factor